MKAMFRTILIIALAIAPYVLTLGCADFKGEDGADGSTGDMGPQGPAGFPCGSPGCVQTDDIADEAITLAKMAEHSVGYDQLVTYPIIGTTVIRDDAVNGDKIDDDSITSDHILDGEVDTDDIATDAVTSNEIEDFTILRADMHDNAVDTDVIQDLSVGNVDLADDAVNSNKIEDLSISEDDIADGQITYVKMGSSAIGFEQMRADAIGSSALRTDSVGVDEIAPNAVGLSEMADNAIGLAEMRDDAIGLAEMRDNAIGNDEMRDNAVDTAEIANGGVHTEDIALNAVSNVYTNSDVSQADLTLDIQWDDSAYQTFVSRSFTVARDNGFQVIMVDFDVLKVNMSIPPENSSSTIGLFIDTDTDPRTVVTAGGSSGDMSVHFHWAGQLTQGSHDVYIKIKDTNIANQHTRFVNRPDSEGHRTITVLDFAR